MNKEKFQHTKNSGFKVPEDYFDSLESKILDKAKMALPLESKIDSGFKVPEGYFDNFKPKAKSSKVINLKKVLYISSIAAAIVLLFALFIPKSTPNFDGLETAAIETYLLNESYETSEIAGLLNEDDLTLETFDVSLDSEDMETYILENTSVENLIDF